MTLPEIEKKATEILAIYRDERKKPAIILLVGSEVWADLEKPAEQAEKNGRILTLCGMRIFASKHVPPRMIQPLSNPFFDSTYPKTWVLTR